MCYVQAFSCKSTDAELPFGRSASPARRRLQSLWRWGQLRSDLSRISGRALQPLPVPGHDGLGATWRPPIATDAEVPQLGAAPPAAVV